jgi:hypothetical protein
LLGSAVAGPLGQRIGIVSALDAAAVLTILAGLIALPALRRAR